MSGGVDYLAERLRKHIASRRVSIETQVWKGIEHEQYMKLCGAHAELEQMAAELSDSIKKANASTDLDEEDAELTDV